MLNKMADELTPGKVLDEVLNYATFIANDDHNSYASTPINDSGRTGAEELTNNLRTQINNGGGQLSPPSCIQPVPASVEGHRTRSVALNAYAPIPLVVPLEIQPMASGQARLRLAISSESCCTSAGSASLARAT